MVVSHGDFLHYLTEDFSGRDAFNGEDLCESLRQEGMPIHEFKSELTYIV